MELENARKSRLEPVEEISLHPIKKSSRTTACSLYWIPVHTSPVEGRERLWLMALFDGLNKVLVEKHKLRQESFLPMKLAAPLGPVKDALHQNQMKLIPIAGLGLKPGAKLPPIPTEENLKPLSEGKIQFNFDDYVGDYSLWLLSRDERWKRDLFLGYGGYTMLYMLPDPKAVPPPIPDYPGLRSMPIFSQVDVDAMWEITYLLSDEFCPKSKAVFGKGFEQDSNFEGTTFIIPLLDSRDFHGASPGVIEEWLTVFDVFIQESPVDNGILIASKCDLDMELTDILRKLRDEKISHSFLTREEA